MPAISPTLLSNDAVARAVALRDLTDPAQGPHAMQLLIERIVSALADRWRCAVRVRRTPPVIGVADNYDRLRYPPDAAARDARYTRYVSPTMLLRTHTTAMVPPALRELAREAGAPDDVLLVCPGLVYRRDCIDRLHTGEPHQVDLWRIARRPLGRGDLAEMVGTALSAALSGAHVRATPADHPYTLHGLQLDVDAAEGWVEVGECGVAHPDVLADAGLSPAVHGGLAMGLGLDRLLMLAKGIDDIRLLRATNPRIAAQMLDLSPYRRVSNQPAIRRDLSIAVSAPTTPEELGDRIRAALGDRAAQVESVEVLSETPGHLLPPAAVRRLGLRAGQKNVLLRLTIRDLDRSLTHPEANEIRDVVYGALHEGGDPSGR